MPDVKLPCESFVPEFVTEMAPLPEPVRTLPVPVAMPVPLATVMMPLLAIVTLPPPWANADTP